MRYTKSKPSSGFLKHKKTYIWGTGYYVRM